jgi:hypothetical protein
MVDIHDHPDALPSVDRAARKGIAPNVGGADNLERLE